MIYAFPTLATTGSIQRRPTANSWFPLPALLRAAASGRIDRVAPRFHGAPTNRSHRVTIETDAPELLARVREDKVDAVIVVPNCPVCHQTSSLVARHIEANGIPTVLMGCAKDIVEHAAVPRFLFQRFSARQQRRQAARCRLAGSNAGIGVVLAGIGDRFANNNEKPSAVE